MFLERGHSGNGGGSRGGGGLRWEWEEAGGDGQRRGAPHPPTSPTPGPAELIISGVLQININNPVTEGIWENRIKRTLQAGRTANASLPAKPPGPEEENTLSPQEGLERKVSLAHPHGHSCREVRMPPRPQPRPPLRAIGRDRTSPRQGGHLSPVPAEDPKLPAWPPHPSRVPPLGASLRLECQAACPRDLAPRSSARSALSAPADGLRANPKYTRPSPSSRGLRRAPRTWSSPGAWVRPVCNAHGPDLPCRVRPHWESCLGSPGVMLPPGPELDPSHGPRAWPAQQCPLLCDLMAPRSLFS